MKISNDLIKKLREITGAGVVEVKKALEQAAGDENKAIEVLRRQGEKVVLKKQSRAVSQGVIAAYIHGEGKVAVLVSLSCETDFVAKNQEFKDFAHELALQVAAMNPVYITPEEVPGHELEKEKEIIKARLKAEGKPEKIWDKIIDGKLAKYYQEVCLVRQLYIKDDTKTIEGLLKEKIVKLGENIKIKQFVRFSL